MACASSSSSSASPPAAGELASGPEGPPSWRDSRSASASAASASASRSSSSIAPAAAALGVLCPPRSASGRRLRGGGSACRMPGSAGAGPCREARGVSGTAACRPSAPTAHAAASGGRGSKAKEYPVRRAPWRGARAMTTLRLLGGTRSMQPQAPPSREESIPTLSAESTCRPKAPSVVFSATKTYPIRSCSMLVLTPGETVAVLPLDAAPSVAHATSRQPEETFCRVTGLEECTTHVTLRGAICCIWLKQSGAKRYW
mmetsp:Transcript_27111/g.85808  ORF Transcript_27111/g.85808 Transcript_27111/m.85808 type:complete len:258 (-) Transcript_27111:1081-1854(-)